MKGKIFALVGFILGCVSVTGGIVAIVFSTLGFTRVKRIKQPKSF
ncbi:MAG: hypothetical protein RSF90_01030 [Pygmaiobacter sp.]